MTRRAVTDPRLAELKNNGCVKIRVTDPKQLSREKLRCLEMGLRLGNCVSSSYHYPWLYVVLGERLPLSEAAMLAEKSVSRNSMKS